MFTILLLLLPTCLPFGFLGHAIVAKLVWKRVPQLKNWYDSYEDFLEHVHWADQHKHEPQMAWAMPLHFYNNLADAPPAYCCNLDHAVREVHPNLIQACLNFTRQGNMDKTSIGYAVHFLTDLHQPLHLTGKQRGGNDWRIEGKSLHLIWDTLLPKHLLRQFHGRFNRLILHLKPAVEVSSASVLSWAGQVNRVNCVDGIWEHEGSLDAYLQLHRPTLVRLLKQAASRISLILDSMI